MQADEVCPEGSMTWSRVKPRAQVHGSDHARERKRRAAQHDENDPCVRCGRPLGPMGPWLHLDHDDHDKTLYRGFAHARCNVRAGSQLGRAVQHAARHGLQAPGPAAPFTRSDW